MINTDNKRTTKITFTAFAVTPRQLYHNKATMCHLPRHVKNSPSLLQMAISYTAQ
jgi:hypothetical protein